MTDDRREDPAVADSMDDFAFNNTDLNCIKSDSKK